MPARAPSLHSPRPATSQSGVVESSSREEKEQKRRSRKGEIEGRGPSGEEEIYVCIYAHIRGPERRCDVRAPLLVSHIVWDLLSRLLRMRLAAWLAASGQRSAALPNAVYLPFKKSNAGVRLLHNSCPPRWYCALFRRPFWRPLRLLRISGPPCLVYKTCFLRVHGIFDSDTTGGWWKTVETFGSHSAHE